MPDNPYAGLNINAGSSQPTDNPYAGLNVNAEQPKAEEPSRAKVILSHLAVPLAVPFLGPMAALIPGMIKGPTEGVTGILNALDRGATQGASFGFGDEIAGAVKAATSGKTYKQARDEERAANESAKQAHPGAYLGGEVGGAVATSFIPGAGAAGRLIGTGTKLGRFGPAVGAAVEGALQGGLSSAGHTEKTGTAALADVGKGAAVGGTAGGTLGLAGTALTSPEVGNAIGKVANGVKHLAGLSGVGAIAHGNPILGSALLAAPYALKAVSSGAQRLVNAAEPALPQPGQQLTIDMIGQAAKEGNPWAIAVLQRLRTVPGLAGQAAATLTQE